MVTEGFTRMYVADVQLNERHARAFDGVVQCYAGMGVSASVEDDACQRTGSLCSAGFVNGLLGRIAASRS